MMNVTEKAENWNINSDDRSIQTTIKKNSRNKHQIQSHFTSECLLISYPYNTE